MAVSFASIFATSCLTLSVAIPCGLYLAGEFAGQYGGVGSGAVAASSTSSGTWVLTPTFTLSDGKGKRLRVIAAVSTGSEAEAGRMCRYMPIVRDRIQRFAAGVRIVGSDAGQPTLRGKTDGLAVGLAEALRLSRIPDVRIIEARYPVTQVIRTTPRQCSDGELT